jgi:hypothetical protein
MSRIFRSVSCLTFVLALLATASLGQSKAATPPAAPVPPQIAAAQTVFIANAGGESLDTVIDETVFDGGPDRPYNEFYAAMKSWGHYQLASALGSADLVLEIGWELTDTGLKLPVLGQLRVQIIDPKTQTTIWRITEYVRGAVLLGNRDKNFDAAMNALVSRVKELGGTSPATQ